MSMQNKSKTDKQEAERFVDAMSNLTNFVNLKYVK